MYPKAFEIPFNSTNKWHLSIHKKAHSNGSYTLYIKGAPERVFALCSAIQTQGDVSVPLEAKHQADFQSAYEEMASKGHRVIGVAQLLCSSDKYPEGFTFKKEEAKDTDGKP
jgi:sodium/potassium-transporting ATPase subunit alpha